jgi:hypothetical protein
MVDELLVRHTPSEVHQVDPVNPGVLPARQLIGDLLRGAHDPAARCRVGRKLSGVAGPLVEFCRLPSGLGLGAARYDMQALEELDVLGQAAVARRSGADARGVVRGRGQAGGLDEDHLGVPAAKARSASEAPAWNSSGVRCGDGLTRCGPSTLYCGPWWLILCTLPAPA